MLPNWYTMNLMIRRTSYTSMPTSGDPVNDIRLLDEESEVHNDIFGRGQNNQGCAPVPVRNFKHTTCICNPITEAVMRTADSFGILLER